MEPGGLPAIFGTIGFPPQVESKEEMKEPLEPELFRSLRESERRGEEELLLLLSLS